MIYPVPDIIETNSYNLLYLVQNQRAQNFKYSDYFFDVTTIGQKAQQAEPFKSIFL